MNKKIFGMSVFILLIATTVPVVESLKNTTINSTILNTSQISMAVNWTEIQRLLSSDYAAGDAFGVSVSLYGDTALIGATRDDDNGNESGSAYVFTDTGTNWIQQAKLLASDGATGDYFGDSVALDGDTALIGAIYDDDYGDASGSAYVFTHNGTTWTQQAKLLASDGATGDLFGGAVSLSGDTALIGAWGNDENGDNSGSAYVFTRIGTTWTQQAKLLAFDGAKGDCFGDSVSLDRDTALIGASNNDDYGDASGSAYVFVRNGTTWTQQAKLLASDGTAWYYFGYSVSLDGNTALIGARGDDYTMGSAYVFTDTGTNWTQQAKLVASSNRNDDFFGFSVSLDGDTALIGAIYDDDNGPDSGSAYVFIRTGTTWTQQAKLLDLDGAAWDKFGWSVSLYRDTALIGKINNSVYVFTKGDSGLDIDITGGFGIDAVITNHGSERSTNVTWRLQVTGGILGRINKITNGTIDIPPGESKTISTGLFFGFGDINVNARADYVLKTTTGTQLFILSFVK